MGRVGAMLNPQLPATTVGDAVVARRRERGIPEHLRVVVGVDVDEARGDDATVRVDAAITA